MLSKVRYRRMGSHALAHIHGPLNGQDNERKDQLVMLAMAARHEMIQTANYHEQRAEVIQTERDRHLQRANMAEDEGSVLKMQLESAYSRLETADAALEEAKATILTVQDQMSVCMKASHVKQAEMQQKFEKDQAILQARFDKVKHELMDAMAQNLNLDSRLRKAQEKLNRMVTSTAAN